MNWNNVSLIVLGLSASFGAFVVALWVSLVIWTFRDMRVRTRDAFAQLLAAMMVLVLGPFGVILYFILRPRDTLSEKYERSLEEEALLQDIEERSICPGCKQPIEPDYMVCPICHTRLRRPCIHCERLIHPRWIICPYCAQSQKPVPGVERAGRITLLDLEEEQKPLIADAEVMAAEEELESVAALEAEAMRNLSKTGYGALPGTEWGAEEEVDAGSSEDQVELFPVSDEAADDVPDDALDLGPLALEPESVDTEETTGGTTDESPRRRLSLFKRR